MYTENSLRYIYFLKTELILANQFCGSERTPMDYGVYKKKKKKKKTKTEKSTK
jgi:hypothetical protein